MRLDRNSKAGTNKLERIFSNIHQSDTMIFDPVAKFRALSPEAQIKEGEDSLLAHILERASVAHVRYPNLGMDTVDTFLSDRDCLRYPTRYVYEFGAEMAPHQFAQPEPDFRSDDSQALVIYLRPPLRERPEYALLAIAYMIPLINYGEVIRDEHCLVYAAALLGMTEDKCYESLMGLAQYCECEVMYPDNSDMPHVCSCPE